MRSPPGEDDVADELRQHLRPEPLADQTGLPDHQVDTGNAGTDLDDLLPLWIIGDQVRLDDPDRTAVDFDQEVVGRLLSFERPAVLADRLADVVAPPAGDVLTAKPLLDQREVRLGEPR